MSAVTLPSKYLPIKEPIDNADLAGETAFTWQDKEGKKVDIEAAGAEEYAVYGWAKWDNLPEKQAWHLLFRLTDSEEGREGNLDKLGDRNLCGWVGAGFL